MVGWPSRRLAALVRAHSIAPATARTCRWPRTCCLGTPVGDRLKLSQMSGNDYLRATLPTKPAPPCLCCRWAGGSPRPWSNCSPTCRRATRSSSSSRSSAPMTCRSSARCWRACEKTDVAALGADDRAKLIALSLPLCRGAPSPRPHRRGDGAAAAGGAARLCGAPAVRVERRRRVLRRERATTAASTLQDNILFGRLLRQAGAGRRSVSGRAVPRSSTPRLRRQAPSAPHTASEDRSGAGPGQAPGHSGF